MLSGLLWVGNLFTPYFIHLYSLATDPTNIFSSRLHAVFFERISISATDIIQFYSEHHRKGIYWTLKHKASRGRHGQVGTTNPGKYHREAWADWELKLSRQIRAKCIVVQLTKWRKKFSHQRRSAGRQKKQDPILMISLNQSSSLERNRVRLRNWTRYTRFFGRDHSRLTIKVAS